MCDTFVTRFSIDGRNTTWFGKNSDREPNEAHEVVFIKGGTHPADTLIKCTYIEIPQVETTFDMILCKPVWMWGAEMGINQHGVVIGNEAVFTKGPQPKNPALTGMDLLRLGLERSFSARDALQCITGLLSAFGQGGNCGFSHPFYYNNSFLIADRKETWVLETVGKDWAARRYENFAAISNAISIETDWDEASKTIQTGSNFARSHTDLIVTHFSQAKKRNKCVVNSIITHRKDDTILTAFQILRNHGESHHIPTDSLTANTVCMHAGFGPIRINQTTGSMVAEMTEDAIQIWITGSSAPCLSVFQPISFQDFKDDTTISSEADWRKRELFHRQALFCPKKTIQLFMNQRDEMEAGFFSALIQREDPTASQGKRLSENCNQKKDEFLETWTNIVHSEKAGKGMFLFRKAWNRFNREGKFHLPVF